MFPLHSFTTILLAFLSFSVHASPLLQRDVLAPPITKPDANSLWPVGTQQIVEWDTSNFPPDSQITNPIGQIILGFNESNSLNLDFDHPLAQGFKLRDGNVTITVPDVTPRDDYLIVLFGDSGDTSPTFAITRIASRSDTSSPYPPSNSATNYSATSLPITGSVTTQALTASVPTSTAITTTPLPTGSTTTSASSSSSSSSSSTSTSASATSTTTTSAAWSMHHSTSIWSSTAPLLTGMAPLIMFLVV